MISGSPQQLSTISFARQLPFNVKFKFKINLCKKTSNVFQKLLLQCKKNYFQSGEYLTCRAVGKNSNILLQQSLGYVTVFLLFPQSGNNYQRLTISCKEEKVIDTIMTTQTIYDIHFWLKPSYIDYYVYIWYCNTYRSPQIFYIFLQSINVLCTHKRFNFPRHI